MWQCGGGLWKRGASFLEQQNQSVTILFYQTLFKIALNFKFFSIICLDPCHKRFSTRWSASQKPPLENITLPKVCSVRFTVDWSMLVNQGGNFFLAWKFVPIQELKKEPYSSIPKPQVHHLLCIQLTISDISK